MALRETVLPIAQYLESGPRQESDDLPARSDSNGYRISKRTELGDVASPVVKARSARGAKQPRRRKVSIERAELRVDTNQQRSTGA
jgi:hypothetical protein